jgi:hypothetical protein
MAIGISQIFVSIIDIGGLSVSNMVGVELLRILFFVFVKTPKYANLFGEPLTDKN